MDGVVYHIFRHAHAGANFSGQELADGACKKPDPHHHGHNFSRAQLRDHAQANRRNAHFPADNEEITQHEGQQRNEAGFGGLAAPVKHVKTRAQKQKRDSEFQWRTRFQVLAVQGGPEPGKKETEHNYPGRRQEIIHRQGRQVRAENVHIHVAHGKEVEGAGILFVKRPE